MRTANGVSDWEFVSMSPIAFSSPIAQEAVIFWFVVCIPSKHEITMKP